MHEAAYYKKLDGNKVQCLLCPHFCVIAEGGRGKCWPRQNVGGRLCATTYGLASSVALDPIEKKPLYHFHPHTSILSLGSLGCNLKCVFCQNYEISQVASERTTPVEIDEIISEAKRLGSIGVAYTYNEPLIWFEFVRDCARAVRKAGLYNVLVTNGLVNPEPFDELLPLIDALNIDIKSIENDFYVKYCGGMLEPILRNTKRAAESSHVEVTNLVIPTLNDKDENFIKLRDWLFDNVGADVAVHLSRYFPCYKLKIPPTPRETLERAREIFAKKMKYVYLGNI